MDDRQDNQAHFMHAFSTPLTVLRGAIDLLRNPKRTANDPISRELIETLEHNCTQLRRNIDALLAHSQIRGDMVDIVIPLDALRSKSEALTIPLEQHLSQALPLTEPSANMATTAFSSPIMAMQEAIDLLRRPNRVVDDTVTRALLDILEGSCARLSYAVAVLLKNSQVDGDAITLAVPLHTLGIIDHSSGEESTTASPSAADSPALSS